jgi:hypothetical protein
MKANVIDVVIFSNYKSLLPILLSLSEIKHRYQKEIPHRISHSLTYGVKKIRLKRCRVNFL